MLRGPGGWAVAVRRADGTIACAAHPARARPARLTRVPFVRGLWAIGLALPLGLRSMRTAVQLRHDGPLPQPTRLRRLVDLGSLVFALAFAVALFGVAPSTAAHAVGEGFAATATEPLVRIATIVGYIAAVGLLPDVRRVFAYHGAEHQVVAAHEFGVKVSAVTARNFSRFHPRCGSTFILIVALFDGVLDLIVPGSLLPWSLTRVVQLPVGIMLAYELLQLATNHTGRWWARIAVAPGAWLQRLTTRGPDDGQLEVASAALHAVLQLEDEQQQQDDEDEDYDSSTDVHGSSQVMGVGGSVPQWRAAETPQPA
jgi:uncharacterized protein YqhQ